MLEALGTPRQYNLYKVSRIGNSEIVHGEGNLGVLYYPQELTNSYHRLINEYN